MSKSNYKQGIQLNCKANKNKIVKKKETSQIKIFLRAINIQNFKFISRNFKNSFIFETH